eukprot:349642-Chlamydomonas_euryale.AAC.6
MRARAGVGVVVRVVRVSLRLTCVARVRPLAENQAAVDCAVGVVRRVEVIRDALLAAAAARQARHGVAVAQRQVAQLDGLQQLRRALLGQAGQWHLHLARPVSNNQSGRRHGDVGGVAGMIDRHANGLDRRSGESDGAACGEGVQWNARWSGERAAKSSHGR